MRARWVAWAALAVWPGFPLAAQQDTVPVPARADCTTMARLAVPPLGEPTGSLARVAELAGVARLTPRVIEDPWAAATLELCGRPASEIRQLARPVRAIGRPSLSLLPLTLVLDENSAYPRDRDNGLLWAGRGASGSAYWGLAGRAGPVSVGLYPGVAFQQNQAFETAKVSSPGFSPWIDVGFGTVIDLPQRFGTESYWKFDPGQSYLRLDVAGVSAGVSTENLRWGPAIRNPLMLSYSGPGFPHAFIGTARPIGIGIGKAEAKIIGGRLTESPYFDLDPSNDHRLLTAWIADLEPRWLPGLYLGLTSFYEQYSPPGGFTIGDYVSSLVPRSTSQSGNTAGNGLASLFARWALPGSGFEAYAEWARDDYAWNWRDWLMEPDHSQVYTLGMQKVVVGRSHWTRILGELTHLEASNTVRSGRGEVTMYTHTVVIQGHTNEGQMLGPPIGPGSDAQFIGVDVFAPWGSTGGYIERVRYDDNAYYDTWARYYGSTAHDVELTGGVRQALYWRAFAARAEATYSYRLDRNFIGLDGTTRTLRTDRNLGLRLGLSWLPGGRTAAQPLDRSAVAH